MSSHGGGSGQVTVNCNTVRLFNLLNISCGALATIRGAQLLTVYGSGFTLTVIALYVLAFGVCILLSEICMPTAVTRWLPFYSTFLGRGLFFIFVGCLMFGEGGGFAYFSMVFILVVGFLYLVL